MLIKKVLPLGSTVNFRGTKMFCEMNLHHQAVQKSAIEMMRPYFVQPENIIIIHKNDEDYEFNGIRYNNKNLGLYFTTNSGIFSTLFLEPSDDIFETVDNQEFQLALRKVNMLVKTSEYLSAMYLDFINSKYTAICHYSFGVDVVVNIEEILSTACSIPMVRVISNEKTSWYYTDNIQWEKKNVQ